MDLVVYSQYYRARTAERQLELDTCLRRNLNHPGISRMVLFCEPDAPPLPQGTVPVELVSSNERITYAEWFRWVKRQGSGIGLLLNADIYLDEGLEHLKASFNTPEAFVELSRTNPGHAGFHLNDDPHWTQDVWGVRAEAELLERRLDARTAHDFNKSSDWPYGGASTVHTSLAPDEDAELEFTPWTRSGQQPAWALINQQAIERGVHQLRHGKADVAQRFLDLQQFTGLSWVHEAVGSAHLQGDLHPFAIEDTVFLQMPRLLEQGLDLKMRCTPNKPDSAGTTASSRFKPATTKENDAKRLKLTTGIYDIDYQGRPFGSYAKRIRFNSNHGSMTKGTEKGSDWQVERSERETLRLNSPILKVVFKQ